MGKPIFFKLNALQSSDLIVHLRAKYVEAKLSDREFAEAATKELGFSVTESMVGERRRMLGIEPWQAKSAGSGTRLDAIEAEVGRIRDAVLEPLAKANSTIVAQALRIAHLESELRETKELVSKIMTNIAKSPKVL